MPNWCAQNVVLGSENRGDLERLASIIRSLPSREDCHPNGFGKYWLWNLFHALDESVTYEGGRCGGRGLIHPNPDEPACLCCPDPESEDLTGTLEVLEGNGEYLLAMTFITAWGPDELVMERIRDRFPSIYMAAHKETDEFGNFHDICDPQGLLGQERYICECDCIDGDIAENDLETFISEVGEAFSLDVAGVTSLGGLIEACSSIDGIYRIYEWKTVKE